MDFKIKIVSTREEANRVIAFFDTREAFDLEMAEFRLNLHKKAVLRSLRVKHHRFWYMRDKKGKVIAAIGVAENERQNGGYYLDYFAVHKDYRRQELGSRLMQEAEEFVRSNHGRYILIDTADTDEFAAARYFYQKHGYCQVGHIPEYYEKGDGRIDYYKKF